MKIYFFKSHIYLFILFLTFFKVSAQNEMIIYDQYPNGQDFYYGGKKKFYKDVKDVIIKNKIEKCSDNNESYQIAVIVKEDAKINLIKDFDSIYIQKNKCAYEFARKILPYLNGWKPANFNNKNLNAITKIWFFPDDLFENYYEGYSDHFESISLPEYPGGINEFRKELSKNFNFNSNRMGNFMIKIELQFVINEDGNMENILITGDEDKGFRNAVIRALSKIKKTWKPARNKNIPVKYRFRIPLTMSFENGFPTNNENLNDGLFKQLGPKY